MTLDRRITRIEGAVPPPEPAIEIVRKFVGPDGRYTGDVSTRRAGAGPPVRQFDPELAGTVCPPLSTPETEDQPHADDGIHADPKTLDDPPPPHRLERRE